MAKAKSEYTAWTIRSYHDPSGQKDQFLIGRFWFHHAHSADMQGHRNCAFETRAQARGYQKLMSRYSKSKVVKIRVVVIEV